VSQRDASSEFRAFRALPIGGETANTAATLAHFALSLATAWTWAHGWWPATALAWCALAWIDHAALARLHEAAHGTLSRRRWLNELHGVLIGTIALTPLSVYRFVHARHHACLGREGDPEFWPYNDPRVRRAWRVAYAWAELAFGWILTPALYSVRTAAAWRMIARAQRRRLVVEWLALAAFWGALLAIVHANGWWEWFIVIHLVPAWLAGSMQTVRKFTEHLGMFGDTIVSMTRMVIYRGPLGRAASASQRHVDHHATHHRHARIPHYALPEATEILYAEGSETARGGRVFPNHLRAIVDMAPWMLDPKVGPQWLASQGLAREMSHDRDAAPTLRGCSP